MLEHSRITFVIFFVLTLLFASYLSAQEKSASGNEKLQPGVYRVGNGVTAPKPLQTPAPEYRPKERKAKIQGTVLLKATIGTDGRAHDVQIVRGNNADLAARAKEFVEQQWRFKPGEKDGQPVPVLITVEVNFHLY